MAQATLEQTFHVGDPARVTVKNVRGAIHVQAGEAGVVVVTATKHPDTGWAEHTQIEMTQAVDGGVTVETRFPGGFWQFLLLPQPCRVDYRLRVPRACAVTLEGVSSDLAVEGLEGEFRLRAVSGDMRLSGLSGALNLGSVSGDIAGERLRGPLRLSTVSGDVRLRESDFPAIQASTVSGGLALDTLLGAGPYRFKSVSGSVYLTLPAPTGCTVEWHSVSGDLRSRLRAVRRERRVVDLHGGGTRLHFDSVSGDLRIDAPRPPEAEAEPVTTSRPDRLAILDRIARSELSVEDGLAALNS
jgi:hypothetical protein